MTDRVATKVTIGSVSVGDDCPLLVIAGPCVLQEETSLAIARELVGIEQQLCAEGYAVNIMFKGSFDKANRTRIDSWRGLGLEQGLALLAQIREETGLAVTTDIHEPFQAEPVGRICDLLQIPAFLARQTSLLTAAARTGKPVHVKKGQFMAPSDMRHVVDKLRSANAAGILLGERGTFFGYGQLVNDFRSLIQMRELGVPVVFDATHSVQMPGGSEGVTRGQREFVAPLARAAVAVGVDAVFLETHPRPEESPSDAANIYPLGELAALLRDLLKIRNAVHVP
ncbi:MAG: 3-deoxy-8-phosphooctulonate synthase [Planctomycetia bacterium]|nr:3-deoxy-8-phosphooctulonate synthase [Planctomycetia bacterium]